MSLDYSFELYYKRCDLEVALLATAAITSEKAPGTLVILPDGKQMTLPIWLWNLLRTFRVEYFGSPIPLMTQIAEKQPAFSWRKIFILKS